MLNTTTGEVVKATLRHEGNNVREFYGNLPRPVRVGIEATGSMQWFVNLLEELGIECLVGHPAEIRAAEPRKQKHDRRDADLLLSLLVVRFCRLIPDALRQPAQQPNLPRVIHIMQRHAIKHPQQFLFSSRL